MDFSYWVWIGTIYLIILTYKDIKHNCLVDERHNWFMSGLTFSMFFLFKNSFWYILSIIVFIILFNILLSRTKVLGEADHQTLTWIIVGFGLIDLNALINFLAVFGGVTITYFLAKKISSKILSFNFKEATPFYPALLVSFAISVTILGFW